MDAYLWVGTLVGALLGLAHAAYLWTHREGRNRAGARALYRGVWAVALWTLFGTYVLSLWILGAIGYGLASRRAP